MVTVGSLAASGQFPQHQAQCVHVDPQEGVSLEVDGSLQDLGGHVPPGPHLTHMTPGSKFWKQRAHTDLSSVTTGTETHLAVGVSWRFSWFEPESEAEVSDAGRQVRLQQNVLTLKVPENKSE